MQIAETLAGLGLSHVGREFPHKLDHILEDSPDADGPRTPRQLHPIFFGSFDWHSCVHGYWMLARVLRRHPTMSRASEIRALFDASLAPVHVALECAYFERPTSRGFERPYGWAWLLKLASELAAWPDEAWSTSLQPLVDIVVARFRCFLPLAVHPVRAGTHGNTAFALCLAWDYAIAKSDKDFQNLLRETALGWYCRDVDCQCWEPSGDDFLSSALIETECMRRLLPRERFMIWVDGFLPRLARGEPTTLFTPVASTDRSDGKLAHLDGVNLSRAWCWRTLAAALPVDDPRRRLLQDAAAVHLAEGLRYVAGDYAGEHWLGSFAVLALDE